VLTATLRPLQIYSFNFKKRFIRQAACVSVLIMVSAIDVENDQLYFVFHSLTDDN
jgi:hypothetical protein